MSTARRIGARLAHLGLDRPLSFGDTPLSGSGEQIRSKRILLTGASSGVGEAAALALAASGAEMILVARGADELDRVRTAIVERGGVASAHTGTCPMKTTSGA